MDKQKGMCAYIDIVPCFEIVYRYLYIQGGEIHTIQNVNSNSVYDILYWVYGKPLLAKHSEYEKLVCLHITHETAVTSEMLNWLQFQLYRYSNCTIHELYEFELHLLYKWRLA